VTLTFDLWPWKSIGFQIFLRTKNVPSLAKTHWKMLILECSQGCYTVKIRPCYLDLWPWKSIGFQTLLRTKYLPSLVKIHWRMLILECSQGCYAVNKIWPGDLDFWPWKSISYYCAHLHIRILQCTKFHELLINHVGEFAMTKCILNCLKISMSKEAQQGSNSMDNDILYTAKFTHHDLKFHKAWWKLDKRFGS
jgi:uncharacterized cysteine cluster protein YcgN (CxxCxxCC family)